MAGFYPSPREARGAECDLTGLPIPDISSRNPQTAWSNFHVGRDHVSQGHRGNARALHREQETSHLPAIHRFSWQA